MLMLLGRIVLDDQQALAARLGEVLDPRQARLPGPRCVVGLVTKEKAPRARPCWRSSSSVTICTGMWRVAGSCFSWLSTVQPSMSGRNTSSETAVGWYCLRQRQAPPRRAMRDQHLEALVARQVDQDARIMRIVLDDQQHGIAGLEIVRGRPAIGFRWGVPAAGLDQADAAASGGGAAGRGAAPRPAAPA